MEEGRVVGSATGGLQILAKIFRFLSTKHVFGNLMSQVLQAAFAVRDSVNTRTNQQVVVEGSWRISLLERVWCIKRVEVVFCVTEAMTLEGSKFTSVCSRISCGFECVMMIFSLNKSEVLREIEKLSWQVGQKLSKTSF